MKYPNHHYHDNCGKDVPWHKRRIDKSTPMTRWDCFRGRHVSRIKDVSLNRPTTYHCMYCYAPLPKPESES